MASTRQLLTVEVDPTNVDRGKTFALDPKDATSVAVPSIAMVNTLPAAGIVQGQTVALNSDKSLYTWDGAKWQHLVGVGGTNCPVGAITTWPTATPPAGWLLCDGGQFDANTFPELSAVLGKNTTPNLSDQFIRGARTPADVGVTSPWSTAFKSTQGVSTSQATQGTTAADGIHQHLNCPGGNNVQNNWDGGNSWDSTLMVAAGRHNTPAAGVHTHSFTLPAHSHTLSGGDSETAPKHIRLYYIICASSTQAVSAITHTYLQAPVPTKGALPAQGNTNGDVRITLDDTHMHVWHDGTGGAQGTWNDIGPTSGTSLPATGALTADSDLVFNFTTKAMEWRTLTHELPAPATATAGFVPRQNAAGTAYELIDGAFWLTAANGAALPAPGNTRLGQVCLSMDDMHIHVFMPGGGGVQPHWVDWGDSLERMTFHEFHDVTVAVPPALAALPEGAVVISTIAGAPHASWGATMPARVVAGALLIKVPNNEWFAVGNASNTVTVDATAGTQPTAANAHQGDAFYNSADQKLWLRTATAWDEILLEKPRFILDSNVLNTPTIQRPKILARVWTVNSPPSNDFDVELFDEHAIDIYLTAPADFMALKVGDVIDIASDDQGLAYQFVITAPPTDEGGDMYRLYGDWDDWPGAQSATSFNNMTVTPPAIVASAGSIFYNTDRLWGYDGTNWQEIKMGGVNVSLSVGTPVAVGREGDIFIDTDANRFFVHTRTGWEDVSPMAYTKWRTGAGVVTPGVGNNGDYYRDNTGVISVKVQNTWHELTPPSPIPLHTAADDGRMIVADNQAGHGVKLGMAIWQGDQAAYNAITPKNANTLYIVLP